MPEGAPRIHLVGLYSAANIGDAAIVGGLLEVVHKTFPGAVVTLSTFDPRAAREVWDLEVVGALPAFEALSARRGRFRQGVRWRRLLRRARRGDAAAPAGWLEAPWPAVRALRAADAVIAVGGTYLNDNYRAELPGRLLELWLATALGKPVALIGHSLGPFRARAYRAAFRALCRRLRLVTVRDDRSLALVGSGGRRTRVEKTADTAFCLTPAPPERGLQLLAAEGIPDGDGPLVGLSVREWAFYGASDPKALRARYEREILTLCDRLAGDMGCRVVFVSTCTGRGGYPTDDRPLCRRLRERMGRPDRAVIVEGHHRPEDLAALLGRLELHVGTRMHSNILALLAGTPAVGIAYEFKTAELFREIGMARFSFPIETATGAALAAAAAELLADPGAWRRRVAEAVAERTRRAWANGDALRERLPELGG